MPSLGVWAPTRRIRCLSRSTPKRRKAFSSPRRRPGRWPTGAPFIERVDLLVKLISHQLGVPNAEIDRTVQTVDQKLNERIVEGGSGAP